MTKSKKKFRLFDAILSVICVIFVAEAAAPVAVLGNSQYFWWIFMIVLFLIPYGLISAELGTSFESEGGLYDWVRKAHGRKMGTRVSWYYWINFPLWMASLAVIFPEMLQMITGIKIGVIPALVIELAFIWIVVMLSFYPVSDSVWILNGAAIIKVLLALIVGGLGIYVAITHGVANPMTPKSFLPSFDIASLGVISVIIFNCLGFEVITNFASDMENPKKQIPQAIISGGLAIAIVYIFTAFGIGTAIPTKDISSSAGLVDSVELLLAKITSSPVTWFVTLVAILFLLTLFGNMVSWSLGVNSVVRLAAKNNDMPKVFAIESKKNGMPIGAAIMNGIVASVVVLLAPIIPNQDLFWCFFALNLVMFLLSYVPMFTAFLKLRRTDQTVRVFKVPGGPIMTKLIAIVPMILLIVSLIFVAIPMDGSKETLEAVLPITIGAVIFIAIGEIIAFLKGKEKSTEK